MLNKKLNIFKSIDTLKIITFWKILQDKNVFLLDLDYYDGKKYSKRKTKQINDIWVRLYDEYYILRDDSKSKLELTKSFKGLKIKAEILYIKKAIESFELLLDQEFNIPGEEIYKMRRKMYDSLIKINSRIKFQHFNSLALDIEYLSKFFNSMQNSYNLNYKKEEEVTEGQVKNMYNVVANAEDWVGRGLDIENMVVSHWLAVERQVINKQKAQKNGN